MTALLMMLLMQSAMFREVEWTPDSTTFHLNAPTEARVSLRLYRTATSRRPSRVVDMLPDGEGRWRCQVAGDLLGMYYAFSVDGRQSPGVFATAVAANGRRACVVDMRSTDPPGWQHDTIAALPPQDWVLYELHHRDFSVHPSSGASHPGKFLALTEPAALHRLTSLGVNAVHLLPSFDFASVDETSTSPQYNWGYDPLNYNVPEGSYSTDAADPAARIREFKQMVQALHRAGLRVVLDVVYNHTYDLRGSNFQRTWPGAYYRMGSNGSGCGNETASERPLMRQFMIESVLWWVNEYHIDGFRFDLMGCHDIATMQAIRQALPPHVLVYGEGWSAGPCALSADLLATKEHTHLMPGVASFCDEMRDGLRGPWNDDAVGAFLAGIPGHEESIKAGIVGMIDHPDIDWSLVNYSTRPWAAEPTQCIAYVSCHDDMCLTDRLRASVPQVDAEGVAALSVLAHTAVLTSQGIPFVLSGEEVLRDKRGVHNSYNSPDSVNRIDWTRTEALAAFRRLVDMRRQHPLFRLGSAEEVRRRVRFHPTEPCVVSFTIDGRDLPGETWQGVTVTLDSNKRQATITPL